MFAKAQEEQLPPEPKLTYTQAMKQKFTTMAKRRLTHQNLGLLRPVRNPYGNLFVL